MHMLTQNRRYCGVNQYRRLSNMIEGVTLLVVGLFLIPMLTVQAAPSTDAMMGYWKLDGGVIDSSGDGHNGAISGNPTWTDAATGVFEFPNGTGDALTFDGDDYVDFGNVNNVGTGDFTLATWFKAGDSVDSQYLINKSVAGGSGYGMAVAANGQLFMYVRDSVVYNSQQGGDYTDNDWHHAVITFDRSGNATFYVDGVEIGAVDISGRSESFNNSGALTLGSYAGTSGFLNGSLDDVRMYSRVLSATEVAELAAGGHTSATWTSASVQDYEVAANWNTNSIPDPYTLVIVANAAAENVALSTSTQLAGLSIESGAWFDLNSWDLTINDNGTFSNEGTMSLDGPETLTGFTNDTDSGAVRYRNGTYTDLIAGDEYYDLGIENNATVTLDAPLDVNGDLILNNGTLSTAGYTITVGGIWDRDPAGTFNHDNGTVVLDGDEQHIWSDNTFYNLTKTSPTDSTTLHFDAGKTQTIVHDLTLTGASGELLNLLSTTVGAEWYIDLETGATHDVAYVYLQDSEATGEPMTAADSVDGDRNTNWTFSETTAPTLTSLSPADNATDVAIDADFSLTFDEDVGWEQIDDVFIKKVADDSIVEEVATLTGSVSDTLTMLPWNDLEYATEYYITIPNTAIQDIYRNAFVGITDKTTWNFTTEDAPDEPEEDDGSSGGSSTRVTSRSNDSIQKDNNVKTTSREVIVAKIRNFINDNRGILLKAHNQGINLPQYVLDILGVGVETSTPTQSLPVRDLSIGVEGEDVRLLQQLLINANAGPAALELARTGATGYFGIQTQYALDEYQVANGIVPRGGYFGPISRAQMKTAGLNNLWW